MSRYMVDTNVIMKDYMCIEKLWDKGTNEVFLCSTVLEELDKHKSRMDIEGYNIRRASHWLDENEDKFKFVISDYPEIPINDNKIISSAKENGCILVSNDINVRLKCKGHGIKTEKYKAIKDVKLGELRKGKHELFDNQMSSDVFSGKEVQALHNMHPNDFVIFKDGIGNKRVGVVKDGKIVRAKFYEGEFNGCKPRNLEQKLALIHTMNTDLNMVTFSGQAGSSKTILCLGSSLEMIERGWYKKLYIVKPPVSLKKAYETGFKSGDFLEKMELPLGSITSNLYNMKKDKKIQKLADLVCWKDILISAR